MARPKDSKRKELSSSFLWNRRSDAVKNCGGPLCKGTFSTGFFGLVNKPAKPSKTVGRYQQELHVAPSVTAGIM